MKQKKKNWLAICLVLCAGSLWGCMGLVVRTFTAYGLTAIEISWIRVTLGSLCMLAGLAILQPRSLRIRWKDLWCFLGTGILSQVVFSVAYFYTMQITSLSVAAVLLYTAPVFVSVMSFFLFKEPLDRRKIVALLMAFGGCILVTGILTEKPVLSGLGIACGVISGFGYALYSIFSRLAMERGYGSMTITLYTFLFAAVTLFPMINVQHIGSCIAGKSIGDLLGMVALVFLVTVAPYLCYTKGLEGMEAGKASIVASIEPVVATLIGMLVFHEENTLVTWIGIGLVLGSILIVSKKIQSA